MMEGKVYMFIRNDLKSFILNSSYIDFMEPIIQSKAKELFSDKMTEIQKAEVAFLFVRDEIQHSFDIGAEVITAKASDVLKYETGICHAKSNLLAALLRSQGIPTGFRFEYITLANDDSMGYCIHCLNAAFLNSEWTEMDARGNKEGVNAEFSLKERKLAFFPRTEYNEYFIAGIYSEPDFVTMKMLNIASTLHEVREGLQKGVEQSRILLKSRDYIK